jgi:hypothetical protein
MPYAAGTLRMQVFYEPATGPLDYLSTHQLPLHVVRIPRVGQGLLARIQSGFKARTDHATR